MYASMRMFMYESVYICVWVYTCVYLNTNTSIHVPQLVPKSIHGELLLCFLVYSQGSWGSESLSNSSETAELVMMGSDLSHSGFPCIRWPMSKLTVKSKLIFTGHGDLSQQNVSYIRIKVKLIVNSLLLLHLQNHNSFVPSKNKYTGQILLRASMFCFSPWKWAFFVMIALRSITCSVPRLFCLNLVSQTLTLS